mmetsp:Transcript_39026/g.54223  ORF Transcript_39026/g.54223 Transcript_39026/m.54223 type:complete len:200 (-) Transcript_39026:4973-5572(-)
MASSKTSFPFQHQSTNLVFMAQSVFQRGPFEPIHRIDIHALLLQKPRNRLQAPVGCRQVKCCALIVVTSVQVYLVHLEGLQGGDVILAGGGTETRGHVHLAHRATLLQQELLNQHVGVVDGILQRGALEAVLRVELHHCSRRQELYDVQVTIGGSQVQGSPLVVVGQVDVNPVLPQALHLLHVPASRRGAQPPCRVVHL